MRHTALALLLGTAATATAQDPEQFAGQQYEIGNFKALGFGIYDGPDNSCANLQYQYVNTVTSASCGLISKADHGRVIHTQENTFLSVFDPATRTWPIVIPYLHAWGSVGASCVTTMEFDTWADIGKFGDEFEALEKAAWPDETTRKAFLKKLGSYTDMHHSDEIYTVLSSMRK